MPILESAVVAVAAEVGRRGYDWAKKGSKEQLALLEAAKKATDGTNVSTDELRRAFAQATKGAELNTFIHQPRDKVVPQVAEELEAITESTEPCSEIVQNYFGNIEDELVLESDKGLLLLLQYLRTVETNLNDIQEAVEDQLSVPRHYRVFDGGDEGREKAAKKVLLEAGILQMKDEFVAESHPFVSRPELEDSYDGDNLLILGPGGSGKSQALAEEIKNFEKEVEHIIVPDEELDSEVHINTLYQEPFTGDVLLVWDDIHDINPERDNDIFRKTINRLKKSIEEQYELFVLATAEKGEEEFERLPGVPYRRTSSLWGDFEVIELSPLNRKQVGELIRRLARAYQVDISDRVKSFFISKSVVADPSPIFITSVIQTAGDELTFEDVNKIPNTALDIWRDQYNAVKESGDERWHLLRAAKMLNLIYLPCYRSLLEGVVHHVFDRPLDGIDNRDFDELVNQQWCVPVEENSNIQRFYFHDLKLEAVELEATEHLLNLSSFFMQDLKNHLKQTMSIIVPHMNLGLIFQENESFLKDWPKDWPSGDDLASKHYATAIIKNRNAKDYSNLLGQAEAGDSEYSSSFPFSYDNTHLRWVSQNTTTDVAVVHNNYANLLADRGDQQEAVRHHAYSLISSREYAMAHHNYAISLFERGDLKLSALHLARALVLGLDNSTVHLHYANTQNERGYFRPAARHFALALIKNPQNDAAHTDYAIFLKDRGDLQLAARHFGYALILNSENATTHDRYATLLEERGDSNKAALHYAKALQLDAESCSTHNNYANFLYKRNDRKVAAKHYALALINDPKSVETHISYSILLMERGDLKLAAKHLRQSLSLDPENSKAHTTYAGLLSRQGNQLQAGRHYKLAVNLDPTSAQAHNNYGSYLAGRGEMYKAAHHWLCALQLQPNNLELIEQQRNRFKRLRQFVHIHLKKGNKQDAIKYCNTALLIFDYDIHSTEELFWFVNVRSNLTK